MLDRDISEAEDHYHTLYQSFLNGQAGILAANMENELAETGRTICPVCRTEFCRGETHHFALPPETIPSKSDVDDAETAAKNAEKDRQNKNTFIN